MKTKKIVDKLKYWYNSIWNYFHFKNKVREAKRLNKLTGKRYFVVPATNHSLCVVDNTYIKLYNKQKGVKKININDLIRMSYFATQTRPLVKS
jgi:hypothetical protein